MTAKQLRRLADQIRASITTSELSRYEISKRSGVDEATLSRFVNEKGSLSLESIEKLAPVLNLQITVKK
jgi:transcriptional regulator with XRE-family HTH domain